MSPFATLLERYRRRAGLGVNELARASAVAPSYVSRLTSGGRGVPTRSTVEALARGLRLDQADTERLLFVAGYCPNWMIGLAQVARVRPRGFRDAG